MKVIAFLSFCYCTHIRVKLLSKDIYFEITRHLKTNVFDIIVMNYRVFHRVTMFLIILIFFIPKLPPNVLKWMSHVLQVVDKQEEHAGRISAQCLNMIHNAAKVLMVLPEQRKACSRESMQKTARKLAFVVWPDPVTRAGVSAKTVDRQKLKLVYMTSAVIYVHCFFYLYFRCM